MKTLIFLLLCLVFLSTAGPGLSAPVEIKFPHTHSEFAPVGRGANLFKVLAEKRLKGKVKVDVYPARQFGNTIKIMEALQSGAVQIAPLPLYRLAELSQKFQVFELPFLFEDEGAVSRFQTSPVTKTLLDAAEKQGYKGLAFWHFGMKQLMANKPLLAPADLKGLKFAVSKSVIPELSKWKYEVIGAAPVFMSSGDIYQALQRGAVDGSEGSWPWLFYGKFYEVQKFISVTNHAYVGFLLTANTHFWNGLPSDIRNQLQAIIPDVTKEVNRLAVEESFHAIQAFRKLGVVQIKTLTKKDRTQWLTHMKPVWNELESKIGTEIVRAAIHAGTAGGGDPCPLGTCRCKDRSCKKRCCY
jgi:C4-dicarboxylate-binding protein DctP